jgi:hypothetical protein
MTLYDLEASGLSEWSDPNTAAMAAYESIYRVQVMLLATRLRLSNDLHEEKDRSACRKLERELDDTYKSGVLTASLLKAGGGS